MKFKVLSGKHQEQSPHSKGEPRKRPVTYHAGDVLEVKHDLCKMFNKPRRLKFLRVSDSTPVKRTVPELPSTVEDDPVDILDAQDVLDDRIALDTHDTLESTGEETPLEESEVQDAFTGLTVKELHNLAEENEIDLGDVTLKDDILRVMRKHIGG